MKRGVTLVELLTVMMILIIVAAATFPVLFGAKTAAKQTVCLENLRQVYLGIKLYEADYDELPQFTSADPRWYKKYTGGTMLKCPNVAGRPHEIDYFVTAGPLIDSETNPVSKKWSETLKACREKREGDFMYAYDPNHVSATEGYRGFGPRIILVRASGAVQNRPYDPDPKVRPCPDLPPPYQQ